MELVILKILNEEISRPTQKAIKCSVDYKDPINHDRLLVKRREDIQ